jgi:deoxyinosine 3'endonuclease (endonuclease V)
MYNHWLGSRLLLGAAAAVAAALVLAQRRDRRPLLTLTKWWLQQRWLRRQLVEVDLVDLAGCRLVGGVDVSFIKASDTDACAALVVVDATTLEVVHTAFRRVVLTAPYIPGYLAFREVGFLLDLIAELRAASPELLPDVIMVDGNGILHPNRFGLACHLGVCAGVPTIGVGKSLHHVDGITKAMFKELAASCGAKGEHALLVGASGGTWGALLRTTDPADGAACKPVVVSVGHGVSLASALELVKRCSPFRVPEPVRQADLRSREGLRVHGAVGS